LLEEPGVGVGERADEEGCWCLWEEQSSRGE